MVDTLVKSAHCVQVCKSLWSLQQSGQLCDITLVVREDTIAAHRTVLAASSPLFLQAVSEESAENGTLTKIDVPDTSQELVQEVVRFAYTGILSLNKENVDGIQSLCERWQMNRGKDFCDKFKVSQEKEALSNSLLCVEKRQLRKRPHGRRKAKSEISDDQSDEDYINEEDFPVDIKIKEEQDLDDVTPSKQSRFEIDPEENPPKVVKRRGRPPKGVKRVPVVKKVRGRVGRPRKIRNEDGKPAKAKPLKALHKREAGSKVRKERVFKKCHKCHQEFDDPQELVAHRAECKQNSVVRPYVIRKCRLCKRVFDTGEECSAHKLECNGERCDESGDGEQTPNPDKSTKTEVRKCRRCDEAFDTLGELLDHREVCNQTKTPNADGKRVCKRCKAAFTSQEEYDSHQMECQVPLDKPTPDRLRYKCDQCDRAFVKKRTLQNHMASKHWTGHDSPAPRYYYCKFEDCDFKTLYPHYIQKHEHWTHGENKSIMCDICGAMAKNEHYLKAHKRIRHCDSEIFTCDICGITIRTITAMKMHHKRVHGGGPPTKLCSMCTYITYTKSELDRHNFQKHGIPLPSGKPMIHCEFCDYKAITKSVMDEHVMRHTAEVRNYPCPHCSKSFITDKDLKGHIQIHNPGRKRHQCQYCEYSTPYGKYKLQLHVQTMHENKEYKPWQCDICNYCTNIKGNLTLHLKNTHKLRLESKSRQIHKLDPLPAIGKAQPTSRSRTNVKTTHPNEQNAVDAEREKEIATSMISSGEMLVPTDPHLQAMQHEQLARQEALAYTSRGPPVLNQPTHPSHRGTYKTMGVTEKEAKMFVLEIDQPAPEPLQPVSEPAVLENSGIEPMIHNLVTVNRNDGAISSQPQHMGNLGFNVQNSRILGPPDVSAPQSQTIYMDTIINSLVSRAHQPL